MATSIWFSGPTSMTSPRVVEYPRADYWIYSFAGSRLDYVFVFREHALRRVDYVDRRGERP